jgi:hypothetical protein
LTNRRQLLSAVALALITALALSPRPAAAVVLPGFFGISPQGVMYPSDYELMEEAGVLSVRLPLYWSEVQGRPSWAAAPKWSAFDHEVAVAAEHGIDVLPVVSHTPSWVSANPLELPVREAWQRRAWARLLRQAVERYGPGGTFWQENPQLPYLPIRSWEIWDEENLVTFAYPVSPRAFAMLIRISGAALHTADPGSKVIIGGFFGRPLQTPPNIQSGAFLAGLYRAGDVKPYFDGVGLHPYVARAEAMRGEIENLRRVMRLHHDAATPLYVTELGWGSNTHQSRWEVGLYGQERELNTAFSMLSSERLRWRIAGAWWFALTDLPNSCQFCDSSGLLTLSREAKPAWYAFNAWTGGDPYTVPRARLPAE